jgi:hypothetical protein
VIGAGVLAWAGLALAQPAVPPAQPPTQSNAFEAPAPTPVAPEEAPPAEVVAPPPIPAPPVQATEVAPASPPAEKVAEEPAKAVIRRARSNVAILQALDKVTAQTIRFEAEVGKPVRYKSLIFTVRACEISAPDEPVADSIAYLVIASQPRGAPGKPAPPTRQVFRGWMYASSPGLNPLEHPAYDAWLITCKAPAPAPAPPSPPKPPAPKASAPKAAPPAPRRLRYSVRLISSAPNWARCSVMNWVSSSRKPPLIRRATRWTRATLLASRARENMLSPKKAPRRATP